MTDGSDQQGIWPLPRFYFSVDISDVATGLAFQEVTGLEAEARIIEYRAGDSKLFSAIKMSGIKTYGNVTLKRGVVVKGDRSWARLSQPASNLIERHTIPIRLMDQDAKPTMIWTLANAWPTKITSTNLKADGNEVAVDTIEIAHEGITIENK